MVDRRPTSRSGEIRAARQDRRSRSRRATALFDLPGRRARGYRVLRGKSRPEALVCKQRDDPQRRLRNGGAERSAPPPAARFAQPILAERRASPRGSTAPAGAGRTEAEPIASSSRRAAPKPFRSRRSATASDLSCSPESNRGFFSTPRSRRLRTTVVPARAGRQHSTGANHEPAQRALLDEIAVARRRSRALARAWTRERTTMSCAAEHARTVAAARPLGSMSAILAMDPQILARALTPVAAVWAHRHVDGEHRPVADPALHVDEPSMAGDDLVGDGRLPAPSRRVVKKGSKMLEQVARCRAPCPRFDTRTPSRR